MPDEPYRASQRWSERHAHRLRFFRRRPVAFNVVDRRLTKAARAAEHVRKRHLLRRRHLRASSSLPAAMMLTPTIA